MAAVARSTRTAVFIATSAAPVAVPKSRAPAATHAVLVAASGARTLTAMAPAA